MVGNKVHLTGVSIAPNGKLSKAVLDTRAVEKQLAVGIYKVLLLQDVIESRSELWVGFHAPGVINGSLIIDDQSCSSWYFRFSIV